MVVMVSNRYNGYFTKGGFLATGYKTLQYLIRVDVCLSYSFIMYVYNIDIPITFRSMRCVCYD